MSSSWPMSEPLFCTSNCSLHGSKLFHFLASSYQATQDIPLFKRICSRQASLLLIPAPIRNTSMARSWLSTVVGSVNMAVRKDLGGPKSARIGRFDPKPTLGSPCCQELAALKLPPGVLKLWIRFVIMPRKYSTPEFFLVITPSI